MVMDKNCLPLVVITNNQDLIQEAESAKVARVMLDLEVFGKEKRQAGKNLFMASHTEDDIIATKRIVSHTKCMVRVNSLYAQSKAEIDRVIANGADIVMLPYFQNANQVRHFVEYVGKRARVSLLLETKEALENVNSIVAVKGVDEIHIGLNDLCLSLGNKNIFEPVINGTIEKLRQVITGHGIQFGFGGVAPPSIASYLIPPTLIIAEQMYLHSQLAIFSRRLIVDLEEQNKPGVLTSMVNEIETIAQSWENATLNSYQKNRIALIKAIKEAS